MAKKKIVTSNIQTNHTLGEYQRYFSHLLAKGKLHRYELKEKNKLDANRQYWKITDEKGNTYYYELPKYIKPDDTRSAYSLRRVTHRRPTRIALAIFAGTAIISFTSAMVTKNVFTPHFPDVPPQPVDLDGLQKTLHDFRDWKEKNPTADATSNFSVSDLASTAIASALYDPDSYHEEGGKGIYNRRPLLTVGYGHTLTDVLFGVDVDISNAFIFQNGNALEESISYSTDPLAPQMGRRDFYTISDDTVRSNPGTATSSTVVKWNGADDKDPKSKDAYINGVGKYPDNPFLYSINEETILEDSTATKTSDGYTISMNLDTAKSVAGYVYRMAYLSGQEISGFKSVHLTFYTNDNLQLITSQVNESYIVNVIVLGPKLTTGNLKTKFYYGDEVPNIPNKTDPFEYSKYPKE